MIECEHVYKQYKNGTNALYDVNFSVKQGEFVYIIGPTGSGKSTLIKLLDGEELPTKGNVEVVGINVGELKRKQVPIYRRNIGVVFQDFRLLPTKTVYENISYPLIFNPAVKYKMMKKLILKTADAMLIGDLLKKPVKELSGGQKQRVALARALVNRPNIIIADEPTAALDKATADEIMEVMKSLNSIGKTIVIVTHDRTVAEKCRRIVELSDGEIISDKTIA